MESCEAQIQPTFSFELSLRLVIIPQGEHHRAMRESDQKHWELALCVSDKSIACSDVKPKRHLGIVNIAFVLLICLLLCLNAL